MVKWIKASKGSRHISVVSSVEGMALKVGSGALEDIVEVTKLERPSGLTDGNHGSIGYLKEAANIHQFRTVTTRRTRLFNKNKAFRER